MSSADGCDEKKAILQSEGLAVQLEVGVSETVLAYVCESVCLCDVCSNQPITWFLQMNEGFKKSLLASATV